MKNKVGKVTWFTYIQVVTSNWFCIITALGILGVILAAKIDVITEKIFGKATESAAQAATSSVDAAFLVPLIIVFILFLMILIYGANIANSIVEEKSARIIETLLCYVKPIELISGKIFGYVLGIATQIIAWVAYYKFMDKLAGMPTSGKFDFSSVTTPALILIVFALVLGFVMYACLFAALASYADNAQDSTQLMLPVGLIIVAAYIISMAILNGVGGTAIDIISYLPFFSPILVFANNDLTTFTWQQLGINSVVFIIETAIIMVVCSKFYRRGVVRYGLKKPTFKLAK